MSHQAVALSAAVSPLFLNFILSAAFLLIILLNHIRRRLCIPIDRASFPSAATPFVRRIGLSFSHPNTAGYSDCLPDRLVFLTGKIFLVMQIRGVRRLILACPLVKLLGQDPVSHSLIAYA